MKPLKVFLAAKLFLGVVLFSEGLAFAATKDLKTEKLILVTLDGVRCEELFYGLDDTVMKHFANKKKLETIPTYRKFWADTAKERRETLMPFFWKTLMVKNGSIIGNEKLGSVVHLKNRWRVSYPGYSEILTGVVDDKKIRNNSPVYNPNRTVLESLQQHLGLGFHQVAAFASWNVMRFIVQQSEDTIFTNSGFEAYESTNEIVRALSKLQFETKTPWDSVRSDGFTFRFAMEHLRSYRPDVLFLALGESDDWAHEKRYDRVLEAIHQSDAYLGRLWKWIESQKGYAGKTTLIITTDHGRGRTPFTWQSHNDKLPGARNTWIAIASPDVAKRGEWSHHRRIQTGEVASTFARFGGLNFQDVNSSAAKPIEFLFSE